MDCFIKRIFEGKTDESIHLQFQKFSRGAFRDRALFRATASPKGYSMWLGNEYSTELVRAGALKLGANKTHVTGVVVSTADLKSKLPHTGLKQFMGIKQYIIDGEMSGTDIVKLIDALPEAFFALSFTVGDTILKIKAKAPKSAKPKTSDEPAKADFCSVKTNDHALIEHFIIEKGWKSIQGAHVFNVNDIELPVNPKTPEEMRRLAKRKGTIVRKAMIDGKEHVTEKNFVA